jgi:hypothetical protein
MNILHPHGSNHNFGALSVKSADDAHMALSSLETVALLMTKQNITAQDERQQQSDLFQIWKFCTVYVRPAQILDARTPTNRFPVAL